MNFQNELNIYHKDVDALREELTEIFIKGIDKSNNKESDD